MRAVGSKWSAGDLDPTWARIVHGVRPVPFFLYFYGLNFLIGRALKFPFELGSSKSSNLVQERMRAVGSKWSAGDLDPTWARIVHGVRPVPFFLYFYGLNFLIGRALKFPFELGSSKSSNLVQ